MIVIDLEISDRLVNEERLPLFALAFAPLLLIR